MIAFIFLIVIRSSGGRDFATLALINLLEQLNSLNHVYVRVRQLVTSEILVLSKMPETVGDLQLWKAKERRAAITQNVPAGDRFTALKVSAKFKVLSADEFREQHGKVHSILKWMSG